MGLRIRPLGWIMILLVIGAVLYFILGPVLGPLIGPTTEKVVEMVKTVEVATLPPPTATSVPEGVEASPTPVPASPTPISVEPTETPVKPVKVSPTPTTAAVVLTSPTPAPTVELPEVVAAFDAFGSYYNIILMKQLGLDVKYGFNLVMIPFCTTDENCFTEAERSKRLGSGEWDVMLTTLDKLALNPHIGKMTCLVDETDGADKLVVNPDKIATINDLRGKRIGFMEGSIGEFFVYYLLNLVLIPTSEVELSPSEDVIAATDLYVSQWVDAVSGWEPDVDASVEAGGNILIDSGRLRVVVDVILCSNQAIAQRSELVQAFHDAWFEALKFQFENPGRAEELVIAWGNPEWSYVEAEGDLTGWLETIAQAGIGSNQIAMNDAQTMGDRSLLVERLEEAKRVWQWAGKAIPEVETTGLIAPKFVLASAENPGLRAMSAPINDSFLLTARPDVAKLTEEELGGATVLAVLPLRKISFEPDSTRLTDQAEFDLRGQVLPVLRSSAELYLKLEGSAAWPGPPGRYTKEDIRDFAYRRALSVAQFLSDKGGIDPDRLVLSTADPKFPESEKEEELEQDRFVAFTIVEPLGR